MKKLLLLAVFFVLTSCASSSQVEEETSPKVDEAAVAGKTGAAQDCVKNPALAKQWGECNVKKTIYSRTSQIHACLANGKKNADSSARELFFKIHLLPTGKVKKVNVEGVSASEKPVSTCIVKEISSLRFAAPPAGIAPVIYFPFNVVNVDEANR